MGTIWLSARQSTSANTNVVSDSSERDREVHQTLLPSLTLSVLATPRGTAEPVPILTPAPATPAPVEDEEAPRPRGARPGDVIDDRYIVEGQIGRGGMGRVLRVQHQALGKKFALKLIKAPIATNPHIRDMFYREARLASGLQHENICTIVDFGEDPSFGLFMVMELLEGYTVHHKLRHDGAFAPKVACDIMWQIAEAVRYIHSGAIIHGDIKSENILVTRTADRRRLVKLLDFGLARADVGIRTEKIEGTPEYLAPERIAHAAPASQASDIYALGVLFYELLVGELPFRGTIDEIFRQVLEERVPRPSAKISDPTFDERADEIVARATSQDPSDRHPDVAGFLYELRTLMNMLGMDVSRRRAGAGASERRARRSHGHREQAMVEVFERAPVPLASVDAKGNVRVANTAFLEFLGVAGDAAGIDLAHSGFCEVYPALLADLQFALERRTSVKRIIYLSEGGGVLVQVAVILTPASRQAVVTAGEVHLALHPLNRVSAAGDSPR